jgi:DNA-directed RNA polymerase specialized sigma subunit
MSEVKWFNAPYIVKIAQEYAEQEVPLETLIACGLKAFGEALKQYDSESEEDLLTFATPQIREAMQRLVGQ